MRKIILLPIIMIVLVSFAYADFLIDEHTDTDDTETGGNYNCVTSESIFQPFNITSPTLIAGDNLTLEPYVASITQNIAGELLNCSVISALDSNGQPNSSDKPVYATAGYDGSFIPIATQWLGKNLSLNVIRDMNPGVYIIFCLLPESTGTDRWGWLIDKSSAHKGLPNYGQMVAGGVVRSCDPHTADITQDYETRTTIFRINGVTVADTTPPSITARNCTSCDPPNGDTTPPYSTSDTTPTFNITTDEGAWCRIGDERPDFFNKVIGYLSSPAYRDMLTERMLNIFSKNPQFMINFLNFLDEHKKTSIVYFKIILSPKYRNEFKKRFYDRIKDKESQTQFLKKLTDKYPELKDQINLLLRIKR